jgi:hypothetical protein
MPHFRPRFSLLTALLLTTIVGLAIVVTMQWSEVGPLREEVRQLRNETGELTIRDATKTHAIQVKTLDELAWEWHVWVPPGRRVYAHSQSGNVPKDGFPRPAPMISLQEGDNWITVSIREGPKNEIWELVMAVGDHKLATRIEIESDKYWFQNTQASWGTGVFRSTAIWLNNNSPLLLRRHRVATDPNVKGSGEPDGPTQGFIVWLECR